MKIGYACINTALRKKRIFTGRGMRKATFKSKGLEEASAIALLNVIDLDTIIKWNNEHDIKFMRVGSDIFPWMSEYELSDLPNFNLIKDRLYQIGQYALDNNIRLTFHPGPFNVLGSTNPNVVKKTIKELNQHSQIFDLMGFTPSHYNKINIHIGGGYKTPIETMDRFVNNYYQLDDNTKSRLTVENDDKANGYSVKNLLYVHDRVKHETYKILPIVFDYHHHRFCDSGLSEKEALELAIQTWPKGITPVVHYSESKSIHENNSKIRPQAHSDFILGPIDTYGHDIDIMVEAKAKESAVLKYRTELITNALHC